MLRCLGVPGFGITMNVVTMLESCPEEDMLQEFRNEEALVNPSLFPGMELFAVLVITFCVVLYACTQLA